MCRVTMGHHRVTIGHLRLTIGHLRLTIGFLKATVVHIRVTIGHFKVTIGHYVITFFSISKHKANTTELHPKVRQTCYLHYNDNVGGVAGLEYTLSSPLHPLY